MEWAEVMACLCIEPGKRCYPTRWKNSKSGGRQRGMVGEVSKSKEESILSGK